nr:MAG TPA: hypothetical protein [Caudoviricetes sp.]
MQARRLRRQRRRRSNMSNKPVTPWNELEGRFFKVDVGSTTGDAIASDHQTGEPVVHYTTDGEIVFNGMKFCQQGGAKRFNKLIVHKAIPMTPEKGNFYYFHDGWIKFKVDLDKLDDSAVFRFPSIEGYKVNDKRIIAFVYNILNKNSVDYCGRINTDIEGKSIAEIKRLIDSSYGDAKPERISNSLVLYLHLSDINNQPLTSLLVKITRTKNLYYNAKVGDIKIIITKQLNQFLMDNGLMLSSKKYEIRRSDYSYDNGYDIDEYNKRNLIDYCEPAGIGGSKSFEYYDDVQLIQFYTYKRRKLFKVTFENFKLNRHEIKINNKTTYHRVCKNINLAIITNKTSKNFSFTAYAVKFRSGKSRTYSTKKEKVVVWNDGGKIKIKKF